MSTQSTPVQGPFSGESYASFTDFDGFPSTTRTASFQTHNTQTSRNTHVTSSTANTSLPVDSFRNVRTLDAENAVVLNLEGGGVIGNGWDGVLRFPQNYPQPPHGSASNSKLEQGQLGLQHPSAAAPSHYQPRKMFPQTAPFVMQEKRMSSGSQHVRLHARARARAHAQRDQQIFRRKSGTSPGSAVGSAALGDAATPSYSSGSRSNGSNDYGNESDPTQNKSASGHVNPTGSGSRSTIKSVSKSANSTITSNNSLQGGGIIFESYEASVTPGYSQHQLQLKSNIESHRVASHVNNNVPARSSATNGLRESVERHGILDNIQNVVKQQQLQQQRKQQPQQEQQQHPHRQHQNDLQQSTNQTTNSSRLENQRIPQSPTPIAKTVPWPDAAPNDEDVTNTSSSTSPLSTIRKKQGITTGGVVSKVNKLVAMFSNKNQLQNNTNPVAIQQNENATSPRASESLGGSPSNPNLDASNNGSKQPLNHLGKSSPMLKQTAATSTSILRHHNRQHNQQQQQGQQSVQSGVQFQVPPESAQHHHSNSRDNSPPFTSTFTSTSLTPTTLHVNTNYFNHHPSNNSHHTTPHSYPPISPARSNAQSSVTGASGESSYCPTGWPGTVDKRGKTCVMQPSYSESEESTASPQRSIGRRRVGGAGGRFPQSTDHVRSPNGRGSTRNGNSYPMQQYRNQQEGMQMQHGAFSFDGDSAAELEDWMKGDAESDVASIQHEGGSGNYIPSKTGEVLKPRSGPVDLDEAYERRSDARSNSMVSGNALNDSRQDSLAGGSEARTAADFHLEAALGLTSSTSIQHIESSPFEPTMWNQRSSSVQGQEFEEEIEVDEDGFPSPNTSRINKSLGSLEGSFYSSQSGPLEEEYRLRSIDTSLSEQRVRASGRRLPSPKLYDDVADFEYSVDSDNNNNNNNHGSSKSRNNKNKNYSPSSQSSYHHEPSPVPQPPTEEALRWNDSRTAPPRPGGSVTLRGYRGFIEKTKDVPNLMDDLESEASTSLGTKTSAYSSDVLRRPVSMGLALPPARNGSTGRASPRVPPSYGRESSSNIDSGSDVFDGLESAAPSTALSPPQEEFGIIEDQILNVDSEGLLSRIGSNTAKGTGANTFSCQPNPFSAHEGGLDISAISQGSANAPFEHYFDEFDGFDDDFESMPDLTQYAVDPQFVRVLVRTFRKICTSLLERCLSGESVKYDVETLEDTKKAFALFEMRSRIMETDIDRGLERRGGTNVVDDIVLTPYFQASQRVRDAVIVSKAWRDGATPKDVLTAHLLTRRSARAHFIRRPMRRNAFYTHGIPYWREKVRWVDDTDFELMRCQSLGAGTMKGFEMFTIGDCQSILLKMTSDNCMQLRRDLRAAMIRQIEAEECMQEEIDLDGDGNIVADAEQIYRDATVEVKSLSIKLVLADKAFTLVRGQMEKLVATIESLLVQFENDDASRSSEASSNNSRTSSGDESDFEEEQRRIIESARRAELAAEVAVREAKLEAERVSAEKQREIDLLKQKLAEMETRSEYLASENRRLAMGSSFVGGGTQSRNSYLDKLEAKSFLNSTFDKDLEEARSAAKERAKQRFKAIASKRNGKHPSNREFGGEEMYNQIDFYSRSLNSVARN